MSEKTLAETINLLHAVFDNYIQHHGGVTVDGTLAKKVLKGAIFTFMDGSKIRNFFVEEVPATYRSPQFTVRFGELEMIVPPDAKTDAKTLPYVRKVEKFSTVAVSHLSGDLYRILMLHAKPPGDAYLVASLKFDYSDLMNFKGAAFQGRPKRYSYEQEPKENIDGKTES